MALLAEEVVEEWLNRQGCFTIRGIKLGVHEIDILAIKPTGGQLVCRHVEVQVSTNPIAYISKVPKEIQKKRGIGPDNAKQRPLDELRCGVREWIAKKFDHPRKAVLRSRLVPGEWSRELVVNDVRHAEELDLFREEGVAVIHLRDIVREMASTHMVIEAAAGNDLFILMQMKTALGDPAPASDPMRRSGDG